MKIFARPCAVLFAALFACVQLSSGEFGIDYQAAFLKTVSTEYGPVQGWTMPLEDDSDVFLDVFVGMPYAKPPVGPLRWKGTEKPDSWTEPLNATYYRPCCTQTLDNIRSWSLGSDYNNTSEDCLYLNVFSTRNISNVGSLQPVMVYIHGGSYRYGSGEEYDPRVLAQQGVTVVTINYRLGSLGFLSTDDDLAPGNYGLLDMVQALHWVQTNIQNFNGDPSMVTVFGQSAGGGAVSLLTFSDLTKDLMHRVIPQSGDALARWAIYRLPDRNLPSAQYLARQVGCPDNPSAALLDCLRGKDAALLVSKYVPGASDFNSAWAPRVDNYFITAKPEELLAAGKFNKVHLLTGTVPDETSDEFPNVPNIEVGFNRSEKESRMYTWSRRWNDHADLMYASVLHEYDWPGNNLAKNRDLFMEMRNDFEYIAPHHVHATGVSGHVPETFLYSFEYRCDDHPSPPWMGVPHFEEIYYIYGTPFWPNASTNCPWGCRVHWYSRANWTPADEYMSRQMMKAWTNFAKTGNPSNDVINWPQFNASVEAYVAIRKTGLTEDFYYKYPRMDFWNRYTPKLLNTLLAGQCLPTTPCPTPPTTGSTNYGPRLDILLYIVLVISLLY